MQKRKFWGWGYQDQVLSDKEDAAIESLIAANFSLDEVPKIPIPLAEDIDLPMPRVNIPRTLEKVLSEDHLERLNHSYGKSFPDLARAMLKQFPHPPDLVAFPEDQEDENLSSAWNEFFHYLHTDEFMTNMSEYTGIKLTKLFHFILSFISIPSSVLL